MATYKISETNPYEDALFLIRSECASKAPAHVRMKNIKLIMNDFEEVMNSLMNKKVVPLQQFPTGIED